MNWRDAVAMLTWHDLVDLVVVAVLFYNLLLLIRGTRAVQMLTGMFFVAGFYYLAKLLNLATVQTLIENFLIFLPFAVIVLFQQEIRRALANFGRGPFRAFGGREKIDQTIADAVRAASRLAERRVGALLVFERREGLRNFVENGIALDALVSYDLLVNLFEPDTPLHDGAVIVQGSRIAAAGCFLPLSASGALAKEYGTRHRAALGLSEETDAVALVVSEETGAIAVACGGEFEHDLDATRLRAALYQRLASDAPPAEEKRP